MCGRLLWELTRIYSRACTGTHTVLVPGGDQGGLQEFSVEVSIGVYDNSNPIFQVLPQPRNGPGVIQALVCHSQPVRHRPHITHT